jgi:hypothetical protein
MAQKTQMFNACVVKVGCHNVITVSLLIFSQNVTQIATSFECGVVSKTYFCGVDIYVLFGPLFRMG